MPRANGGTITALAETDLATLEVDDSVSELAIAHNFGREAEGVLRYSVAHGWLALNPAGTHWVADDRLRHYSLARQLAQEASRAANGVTPAQRKSMRKASAINGIVSIARADPRIICVPGDFDVVPWDLNTPAGVVDLRSGRLRQRSGELYMRCTGVSPLHGAPDAFLAFLNEVFPDEGFRDYMQMALGACLFDSRVSADHWFMFLQGVRRAGKNTLMELMLHVMGNYARAVPTQIFTEKGGNEHPTLYATLEGLRLAVASETSDGDRFNGAVVKQLTGDQWFQVRTMRADYRQAERRFRLVLQGNERPGFDGGDAALVFRLHLVPFTISFADRVDVGLPAKLRANGGDGRFLAWLIGGAKLYAAAGFRLAKHAEVERVSGEYAEEMDDFMTWLNDETQRDSGTDTRARVLYASYRRWKESRGEPPLSMRRWGPRMVRAGFGKYTNNGVWYAGIKCRRPPPTEAPTE